MQGFQGKAARRGPFTKTKIPAENRPMDGTDFLFLGRDFIFRFWGSVVVPQGDGDATLIQLE